MCCHIICCIFLYLHFSAKKLSSLFTVCIFHVFWFHKFLHPALSNADSAMNSEVKKKASDTLSPYLQNLLDAHAPPLHVLRNDQALSVAHRFHDF